MTHDFDWSSAPHPWDGVGPAFRKEVERIAADRPQSFRAPERRPLNQQTREAGLRCAASSRAKARNAAT